MSLKSLSPFSAHEYIDKEPLLFFFYKHFRIMKILSTPKYWSQMVNNRSAIVKTQQECVRQSSKDMSAVWSHCQSRRTGSKENWYSMRLQWRYLKAHHGPQSNPLGSQEKLPLQHISCSVSRPAVYLHLALTEAADVHPLFPQEDGGRDEQEKDSQGNGNFEQEKSYPWSYYGREM